MPIIAVDWDGTCVEDVYPECGEWLPGAVKALRAFDSIGTVIIHSVRVAPVAPFKDGKVPLPGEEVPIPDQAESEYQYIRSMLDKVGLGHIEIWRRPYKPPADIYIDDRALCFEGDWEDTLREVFWLMRER
jgi:hypothetical protein